MSNWKTKTADRGEKFRFDEKGDTLEGYFLGSRTVTINDDEVLAHNVRTDKGEVFSPLGSADLNRKLDGMPAGTRVRIVYNGKKNIGKGKSMKEFTVDYDDTDILDLNAAAVTKTASTSTERLKGAQLKA